VGLLVGTVLLMRGATWFAKGPGYSGMSREFMGSATRNNHLGAGARRKQWRIWVCEKQAGGIE
jgi:hypothetical protein